ncbi:MAG: transcriptional repressor [Methylophaga sp.]|nr:MAG: transcriptional repressor [Methylophaga sp.]
MSNKNRQQALQLVKQLCQQRGLKLTTKRSNILQLMLTEKKGLSTYDIVDSYLAQYHQKISPVSVYRMLGFLIVEKLVHKISSNSQYIVCSHITCSHSHQMPLFLICNNCNQVEEVDAANELPAALEKNIVSTGFQLQNKALELHGICQICKNI